MEFDLPKDTSAVIKVIGVGGGGSNAVNHMFKQGIYGVDFIVCNTDRQSLDSSPVPIKIQLGVDSTGGRGAGSIAEVGMQAANENIEEIRSLLSNETNMVFITAGLGGGTGTGAAPVIAQIAKDLGVLTVGIVTVPFKFEGKKRRNQAEEGLIKMRENVDTLLVINNQKLYELGRDFTISESFAKADDVLTVAAKGIAELISVTGYINVDFNDVRTVMKDSGQAIMGNATASGEYRASEAVQSALNSPLLNDNDIEGAKYVLLNITYGDREITMSEIETITDYIEQEAGPDTDVIWGHGYDESLGDNLNLTLIATGFKVKPLTGVDRPDENIKIPLDNANKSEIKLPLSQPTESEPKQEVIEIEHLEEPLEEEVFIKQEDVTDNTIEEETNSVLENEIEEETVVEETNDKIVYSLDESINDEAPDSKNEKETKENEDLDWEIVTRESEDKKKDPDVIRYNLEDLNKEMTSEAYSSKKQNSEDYKKKVKDRFNKIKDFTSKLKKAEGITEFENEPAYVRRNIELDSSKPSEEDKQSRFELGEDENGNPSLGKNSFLHDNVD